MVSKWLPDSQEQAERVVELRESLLALLRFTQRAWAAYAVSLSEGTIEERPCPATASPPGQPARIERGWRGGELIARTPPPKHPT